MFILRFDIWDFHDFLLSLQVQKSPVGSFSIDANHIPHANAHPPLDRGETPSVTDTHFSVLIYDWRCKDNKFFGYDNL